jgi:chemotaxis methyl-accepting protein methylase
LGRRLAGQGALELRAWSAGCSTGEEAYSLAMLLEEAMPPLGLTPRILATDIDLPVLEKARRGLYPAKDARGLKEGWKCRYIHARDEGCLEIDESLRRRIRFQEHHLLASPPPMGLDLILCRNVMIYFSKDQHQPLFAAFHRALNPGGMLMLGKTESMMGRAREGFACLSARERVYQRQEAAQ